MVQEQEVRYVHVVLAGLNDIDIGTVTPADGLVWGPMNVNLRTGIGTNGRPTTTPTNAIRYLFRFKITGHGRSNKVRTWVLLSK